MNKKHHAFSKTVKRNKAKEVFVDHTFHWL